MSVGLNMNCALKVIFYKKSVCYLKEEPSIALSGELALEEAVDRSQDGLRTECVAVHG